MTRAIDPMPVAVTATLILLAGAVSNALYGDLQMAAVFLALLAAFFAFHLHQTRPAGEE